MRRVKMKIEEQETPILCRVFCGCCGMRFRSSTHIPLNVREERLFDVSVFVPVCPYCHCSGSFPSRIKLLILRCFTQVAGVWAMVTAGIALWGDRDRDPDEVQRRGG